MVLVFLVAGVSKVVRWRKGRGEGEVVITQGAGGAGGSGVTTEVIMAAMLQQTNKQASKQTNKQQNKQTTKKTKTNSVISQGPDRSPIGPLGW